MKVYKYYPSKYKTAHQMGFVYINTFDSIRQYDESHLIGDQNEAMVTNNTGHFL